MPEPIDITKARAEARKLFTDGSARAVYIWVLKHGMALLNEADENERIIQTLRCQRDEAEASVGRVRELADRWANATDLSGGTSHSVVLHALAQEFRDALDGDQ
ncbi:hypothetical protein [Rhodococcus sp. YH1]|uniref:hypothetical protein n=1 Tax=Rhodococcus sp. YH1 TaxID=89066 RepID=UPI001386DE5C|nr:hypothetical protein [Rhodococcus sp. YH1]